MGEDYLSRFDVARKSALQINQDEASKRLFAEKEGSRKNAFRKARKEYSERFTTGSGGKKIKDYITAEDFELARYFLGEIRRRELSAENVRSLYGNSSLKLGEFGDKTFSQNEIGPNRARIQSIAYHLLANGNMRATILGANLYAKLGKGKKAIPKIVRNVELFAEKYPSYLKDEKDVLYLKSFIKRHSRDRSRQDSEHPTSGLEGRFAVFALSTLAGIALSAFSFNATGNVVGSSGVLGTWNGLAGIFLFVFGLFGMFFSGKKY